MSTSHDTYLCRAQGDDRAFLDDLRGRPSSDHAIPVNESSSLRHSAVWAAINRISGDIAKLPFNLYERLDDDSRELADTHPTYRVVRRQANPLISSYRFWRTMMLHALLWNRGYGWIERNSRMQAIAIYNLHPAACVPVQNPETGLVDLFRIFTPDNREVYVGAYDVLDITGMQNNEYNDLVTWQLGNDSTGVGLAAQRYLNKFFTNGARAGGYVSVAEGTTRESAGNLSRSLEESRAGTDAWFKLIVLRDGANVHTTSVTPSDAQMVELLAANVRDVARWFNIPPSKIGLEEKGAYGSREQDARDYLDSTLSPWLTNLACQCWLKLLAPDAQRRDRYYFEHNTGALLETEFQTKLQTIEVGIRSGLYSPNEGRKLLNLNPRTDEYGDLYYYSNNMQPARDEPEPEPEPEVDEPGQDDEAEDSAEGLRESILAAFEARQASIVGKFRRRLETRRQADGELQAAAWWQLQKGRQRSYLASALRKAAEDTSYYAAIGTDAEVIGQDIADMIIREVETGGLFQ